MAYLVSNEYKQVIYGGDYSHNLKIWFNNNELENADLYCEKLVIKKRIIPNGEKSFSLNNFVSQEIELTLHNINLSNIVSPIKISLGTKVNNAYEYVPIGIFNIQEIEENDKNKFDIICRDNSSKFDFNYNAKPLLDENNGTATLFQIFNDICLKAGVETTITTFSGQETTIGIYDNTISARSYISNIAEQSGNIATIDREGKLIFINLNQLTEWEIPLDIVESYEIGTKYKISKVVYEDGIRRYEAGNDNDDTLFVDTSNQYITNQEQIDEIYNKVNGFEIDSVTTGKILGNPAIDGYDIIKIEIEPNVYIKTLATTDLTYTGVLIDTFETTIGEEEKTQNVTINSEATYKKWAKTQIDNVEGKILLEAGRIDEANQNSSEAKLLVEAQGTTIQIISKNIDTTTGEIREVTTTNGYTFNKDGLNIYTDNNSYNTLINNTGTYYRDGNVVVAKTDKAGFLAKDFSEQGQHQYSYNEINDIYEFIEERIEVEGEIAYATFWNGSD